MFKIEGTVFEPIKPKVKIAIRRPRPTPPTSDDEDDIAPAIPEPTPSAIPEPSVPQPRSAVLSPILVPDDDDIITITSVYDDDLPNAQPRSPSPQPVSLHEVIVIDDDDTPPPPKIHSSGIHFVVMDDSDTDTDSESESEQPVVTAMETKSEPTLAVPSPAPTLPESSSPLPLPAPPSLPSPVAYEAPSSPIQRRRNLKCKRVLHFTDDEADAILPPSLKRSPTTPVNAPLTEANLQNHLETLENNPSLNDYLDAQENKSEHEDASESSDESDASSVTLKSEARSEELSEVGSMVEFIDPAPISAQDYKAIVYLLSSDD